MNDDDLLDRLRRAAAAVPPSTLDLQAVLRSARRQQVRHRAVVATGCVAAVAGVGAVAPALPGLLPPGPVQDVAAAALAGDACPGGVTVDWDSARTAPVVRSAHLATASADGEVHLAEAVRHEAAPEVWGPDGLADGVRREVLVAAREQDELGIYRDGELFDEVGEVLYDPDSRGTFREQPTSAPLSGFDAARRSAPTDGDGVVEATGFDGRPGTFVLYDEGRQHTAEGRAGCGDDLRAFHLTFAEPVSTGVVDCSRPVDTLLAWALKESVCPDGATAADGRSVDMSADDELTVLTLFGLPAAQG
jgi:hypothetical protein